MSTPSLAVTADGELENEYYWLACNVCTLVGRDRHLACRSNNENYWLACNVRALVGRDRHSACCLNYFGLPAMSAPSLAATADGKLESVGSPAMHVPLLAVTAIWLAI